MNFKTLIRSLLILMVLCFLPFLDYLIAVPVGSDSVTYSYTIRVEEYPTGCKIYVETTPNLPPLKRGWVEY